MASQYAVGDTIKVPAKIEQIEVYDGEITLFLSSDIWDGYGELVVKEDKLSPEGKKLARELAKIAEIRRK